MHTQSTCPECGAVGGCEESFHNMLYWENEHPELGEVHHLLVLCYHLQHPALLSQAGVEYSKHLLVDFLERGLTPAQVRHHRQAQVDSSRRNWKIRGKPGALGAYRRPLRWTMTALDVLQAGPGGYVHQVHEWAHSILSDLRSSGNLD